MTATHFSLSPCGRGKGPAAAGGGKGEGAVRLFPPHPSADFVGSLPLPQGERENG
jgi:hypothetical protein